MRTVLAGMILSMLLAAPVFAAENAQTLRKEFGEVNKQIRAAMRKASKDENVRELRKALRKEKRAFGKACGAVPEVQEIDKKLAELKKQRGDLIEKNEDLAEPRTAYKDALGAYDKAVDELTGLGELRKKQAELRQKMQALREQRRKKAKKKADEQPAEGDL